MQQQQSQKTQMLPAELLLLLAAFETCPQGV
jgi:hypothetical protein